MHKIEIVEMALDKQLSSLIVVCKDEVRRGKIGTNFILKMLFNPDKKSPISEEDKIRLRSLYQKSGGEYTRELIMAYLNNKLITSFKKGTSYLLPSRYQRFYNQCVTFSTDDLDIYFSDNAISKFRKTIFNLSERSKKDSFSFVKGKIMTKEACNLGINITNPTSNFQGRGVYYSDNDEYGIGPSKSVYYSIDINSDGIVDPIDVDNILELIELFRIVYGDFRYIKYNDRECVAFNNGSMKVTGIDLEPKVFKKTISSLRERNVS